MAEPRIQYAKTSDGVSIAYWTMGEGPPLLLSPPMPAGNIAGELALPELRALYERLAQTHLLIRYDPRGNGASQRDPADSSRMASALDIEAVLQRLDVGRAAVLALTIWTQLAIVFAARRPELVSHLILWDGWASPADMRPSGRLLATRALLEHDWTAYTDAWAHTNFGWKHAATARLWSRCLREATTPELTAAWIRELEAFDVSPLLPRITAPALVVGHRDDRYRRRSAGPSLAANLASARLVTLEGPAGALFWEPEQTARLIDEFTGVAAPRTDAPVSVAQSRGGLVTILFTDLVASTALTQRLGDAKAQELVRVHNSIVREALAAQGGSEIKHTGDGIMASFPTASGALECAVAIQTAVEAKGARQASPLHVLSQEMVDRESGSDA